MSETKAEFFQESLGGDQSAQVHQKLDERSGKGRRSPVRAVLQDILIFFRMLADHRFPIPGKVKLILLFTVIYLISPIDLIPDFLFPIGYLDDAAVLAYAVKISSDLISKYKEQILRR